MDKINATWIASWLILLIFIGGMATAAAMRFDLEDVIITNKIVLRGYIVDKCGDHERVSGFCIYTLRKQVQYNQVQWNGNFIG